MTNRVTRLWYQHISRLRSRELLPIFLQWWHQNGREKNAGQFAFQDTTSELDAMLELEFVNLLTTDSQVQKDNEMSADAEETFLEMRDELCEMTQNIRQRLESNSPWWFAFTYNEAMRDRAFPPPEQFYAGVTGPEEMERFFIKLTRNFTITTLRSYELECVQAYVESGFPVNAQDHLKGTALHRAVASGSLELVEYLLEQDGIDVLLRDHSGALATDYAWESPIDCGTEMLNELIPECVVQGTLRGISMDEIFHRHLRDELLQVIIGGVLDTRLPEVKHNYPAPEPL